MLVHLSFTLLDIILRMYQDTNSHTHSVQDSLPILITVIFCYAHYYICNISISYHFFYVNNISSQFTICFYLIHIKFIQLQNLFILHTHQQRFNYFADVNSLISIVIFTTVASICTILCKKYHNLCKYFLLK